MTIQEFTAKVEKAVKEVLGDEYRIRTQEILKNNETRLSGLMIQKEDQNVAPTIYLNGYHQSYEEGETFGDIISRIIGDYRAGAVQESVDISFFEHFDKVKDRVCYRLISAQRNEQLLQDIPYVPFLDLAIVFFYAYYGEEIGEGSILIHNTHMKKWGVKTEELMKLAIANTPKLFGGQSTPMMDMIREMAGDEMPFPDGIEESPMIVLSNRQKINGATAMLYPGMLEELANRKDSNLYVIPSSVHEVIVLPDTGAEDAGFLRNLICDINRTQLQNPEILSDTLYYYDRGTGRVRIA